MKVILIRKSGKNKSYHAAAILIEPLGALEGYTRQYLIGGEKGVIREISEKPRKGTTYAVYDTVMAVPYQIKAIDWLKEQIGKKISKPGTIEKLRDSNVEIQKSRKKRKVWTMPELIFAAMGNGGVRLFGGYMPNEMTASLLSKSANLFYRGKIEAK